MNSNLKVNIKRIDKNLPLPKYETEGAVAFDILAREKMIINPKELALIPGNVIIKIPKGYMLHVALRSGGPKKKGLLMPHGMGIIDQDYCGENDEIKVQVYNFRDTDCIVDKGERIAQGVFVRIDKAVWNEVESMDKASRGGFGSTDKKN